MRLTDVTLSLRTDNGSADQRYRLLKWIARKVGVTLSDTGARMAKEFPDEKEACAISNRETSE